MHSQRRFPEAVELSPERRAILEFGRFPETGLIACSFCFHPGVNEPPDTSLNKILSGVLS